MTKLKILALIFALLALTLAQEATDTGTETETSGSISPSETGVSSEPPIVSGTITEIETSDSETSIDSGSVTESETGETSETSETSIDSGSVTESETSETGETSIDSGSVTESETSETSIDSGSVTESESSETATEETETETSTNTEPEGATDCEDDARMCPDGRSVGRDPNNNCDFFPCPDADTKCDWCIPETQVNETEPATVSVPEDCPLEICGICYVNGAPLGNAANSSCGYGTSRFGGFCACWSGAYGENCTIGDGAQAQAIIPFAWRDIANINYLNLDLDVQENIHFQYNYTGHVCTSFLQVEPLRTVAPPSILSASLVNNSLEIRVSQPMVNGRAETLAYLNAGHDIADCIYPRSDYILKEIEGCNDIFNFSIPWDLSSQCNWMILDEETHTSYCGQVILQHTEWMENICEWRFVQSVLNIKIRLQKYAKVTINTVIVNRPTITAAITNQIVLVNCPEPVLIEITSVINWPYKLDTNFNLSLTPAGKVQNFSLDFDDCTAAENNTCKQRWRTLLDLTGSACTLDGSYQLSFPQIACASDEDCNLQGEDLQPVVIDYTLTSENFCAVFRIDISLTASIEMFEDAEFNTSRSLFLIGQTAYFLVSARSQANTQENPISFTAIRIRSVTLRGELNNIPVYVVENGEAQNLTTVSGLTSAEPVEYEQLDRSSLNEVAFSFVMSNDLMTRLLRKSSRSTFIVGVEIEVDYASGERKRGVFSVLSTGTDSATFSVEAAVSNFNSEPLNDSSATGVVMSLLLLAFFALMF